MLFGIFKHNKPEEKTRELPLKPSAPPSPDMQEIRKHYVFRVWTPKYNEYGFDDYEDEYWFRPLPQNLHK